MWRALSNRASHVPPTTAHLAFGSVPDPPYCQPGTSRDGQVQKSSMFPSHGAQQAWKHRQANSTNRPYLSPPYKTELQHFLQQTIKHSTIFYSHTVLVLIQSFNQPITANHTPSPLPQRNSLPRTRPLSNTPAQNEAHHPPPRPLPRRHHRPGPHPQHHRPLLPLLPMPPPRAPHLPRRPRLGPRRARGQVPSRRYGNTSQSRRRGARARGAAGQRDVYRAVRGTGQRHHHGDRRGLGRVG
ncbi:hypothetical protein B0T18DRAFT_214740 [Schizothecium vesticola]|uniref:Uncharacterized protein n=1 Tax=Schizothecium vesticola TaxID=314040 RepID=A0AA40JZE4_9PEZI|nr:hypothetical protein B0T18DRAFT_214740 [Schizothecium vesticola]